MYPAYRVVVGGVLGRGKARLAHDIGQVAAKHLPEFVTKVVADWRESGVTEFGTWIDGPGEERVKAIAAPYENVPDWDTDNSYYFDWGATEAFSPTRGGAECSAGLFDLIEIDRQATQTALAELAQNGPTESVAKTLAFHACRTLLVARGIEPSTPVGVYDGFLLGFVSEGLVSEGFRDLVQAARDGKDLADHTTELVDLAKAVEALYQGMDDSLRFSADAIKAAQTTTARQALEKDFRGVACPLNFVKAKIALEDLAKGAVLRMLLDDGEPIRNVPGSLSSEGHSVLSQERDAAGHWIVEVRKA